MRTIVAFIIAALVASASGCTKNLDEPCVGDIDRQCRCSSGATSRRVCVRTRWSPCLCDGGEASRDDSTSRAGRTSDSGSSHPGTNSPEDGGARNTSPDAEAMDEDPTRTTQGVTVLSQGQDTLIAAFASPAAVVVVLENAVVQLDRKGKEIERWEAPRPLTAAALEDDVLAIADGAQLTALALKGLQELSVATLVEPCETGVIVSDARFVCGPSNDWDRIFYTYDLTDGNLLASSDTYTYNGIPMRRVPGQNAFVTVSVDTSPSDFHLYRMGDDDAAYFVGESPYHGDFGVRNIYAFDAKPTQNLITHQGLLLDFSGEDCNPEMNSFTSGCFVRNGSLGTLTGSQSFAGMTSEDGVLYGLVDPSSTYSAFEELGTERGYVLQSIDIEKRTVLTRATYRLPVGKVLSMERDPSSENILVAYRVSGDSYFDSPYPGYEIVLLELEP